MPLRGRAPSRAPSQDPGRRVAGRLGAGFAAGLAALVLAAPASASVRFLVDEALLLAGDWRFPVNSPTNPALPAFRPETFRLLPFDPDIPEDEDNDTIFAGYFIQVGQGVIFRAARFQIGIPGAPDDLDLIAEGGLVTSHQSGQYTNSRAGPGTPIDFYAVARPDPFGSKGFRGRFCFAAPGGIDGGRRPGPSATARRRRPSGRAPGRSCGASGPSGS